MALLILKTLKSKKSYGFSYFGFFLKKVQMPLNGKLWSSAIQLSWQEIILKTKLSSIDYNSPLSIEITCFVPFALCLILSTTFTILEIVLYQINERVPIKMVNNGFYTSFAILLIPVHYNIY